jgi:orotidine-5'-phosphate decarboxylase
MNAIARKLQVRMDAVQSLLCVGLDTDVAKLPAEFHAHATPQFAFNKFIIDATAPFAAAFKPNTAFYEARGEQGIHELWLTMQYLRENYPDIVTVCDAKRADIGNTNAGYATFAFDWLGCDAITLHPYLGREALAPFLERDDKACIVLCRTSNPGAGDVQDMVVDGRPLWQAIAEKVTREWDRGGNCMLVTGATWPEEMRVLRALAPQTTFLVPGVGAQGGDVRAVVEAGLDAEGRGLLISASRSVQFADDPAAAASALREDINAARDARSEVQLAGR